MRLLVYCLLFLSIIIQLEASRSRGGSRISSRGSSYSVEAAVAVVEAAEVVKGDHHHGVLLEAHRVTLLSPMAVLVLQVLYPVGGQGHPHHHLLLQAEDLHWEDRLPQDQEDPWDLE